jgi:hypothetical protein
VLFNSLEERKEYFDAEARYMEENNVNSEDPQRFLRCREEFMTLQQAPGGLLQEIDDA